MDPHKEARGKRLKAWIKANGGAAACLVAAGYERGTDAYNSRMSHLSQSSADGMGHTAAIRWEHELEKIGMEPGTLTNNLEESEERKNISKRNVSDARSTDTLAATEGTTLSPPKIIRDLAYILDYMTGDEREKIAQMLITLARAPDSKKAIESLADALDKAKMDYAESIKHSKPSGTR